MVMSYDNDIVVILMNLSLASNFREPLLVFSGGTNSGKRKGLTLVQGKTVKALTTDTIIDFVCLTNTPWNTGTTRPAGGRDWDKAWDILNVTAQGPDRVVHIWLPSRLGMTTVATRKKPAFYSTNVPCTKVPCVLITSFDDICVLSPDAQDPVAVAAITTSRLVLFDVLSPSTK